MATDLKYLTSLSFTDIKLTVLHDIAVLKFKKFEPFIQGI